MTIDLGFNSDKYQGEVESIPYTQILNSPDNFGLAITPENAEATGFVIDNDWQIASHTFNSGDKSDLIVSKAPRLLILHKGNPLIADEAGEISHYTKEKASMPNVRVFSYLVVLPVSKDNQLLADSPFRLKSKGYGGYSLLRAFGLKNEASSFKAKFLRCYQQLTGDKSANKSSMFYAHGVFQPTFTREMVTSRINNQSSYGVVCNSYLEPTTDNFLEMIIKGGSETSQKIEELWEMSKDWTTPKYLEAKSEETQEVSGYPIDNNYGEQPSQDDTSKFDLVPF